MENHPQKQYEWEHEMSVKILDIVKSELYLEMRFMDVALSALKWHDRPGMETFATDGDSLYYSAEHIIKVFKGNSLFLSRVYLHTILHCIYSQLWLRQGRNKEIWNLACDIVVEYTIDNMDKGCINRAIGWIRQKTYELVKSECKDMSSSEVYDMLILWEDADIESLKKEFYVDSHIYWPDEEKGMAGQNNAREKWDKIARQTSLNMDRRGDEKDSGEDVMLRRLKVSKSSRSYREFLKKFAVLREEIHCNEEEFDMNFYTYGLSIYGNMPLVEPLETREVRKIYDFVIVVDTSYSTSGSLVKGFLKETFGILSEVSGFFKNSRVRIIQCDDEVRADCKITDMGMIDSIFKEFNITGGGNTDFRPAFEYVDRLIETGEIRDLKGLLYFTDGIGTYPSKRPSYDTAFIYLKEFDSSAVPPWAITLRILPEQITDRAG